MNSAKQRIWSSEMEDEHNPAPFPQMEGSDFTSMKQEIEKVCHRGYDNVGDALRAFKDILALVDGTAPQDIAGWKPQRWMGPIQLARKRDDTHEEAMTTMLSAARVCSLSYEEAALGYARARGFIRDDAEMMCDPVKEAGNG